jgi:hypothetical protein
VTEGQLDAMREEWIFQRVMHNRLCLIDLIAHFVLPDTQSEEAASD